MPLVASVLGQLVATVATAGTGRRLRPAFAAALASPPPALDVGDTKLSLASRWSDLSETGNLLQ